MIMRKRKFQEEMQEEMHFVFFFRFAHQIMVADQSSQNWAAVEIAFVAAEKKGVNSVWSF